jgi:hypothetical protein
VTFGPDPGGATTRTVNLEKGDAMNAQHLIVVGVDGSDGGRRALEWAVREADARAPRR